MDNLCIYINVSFMSFPVMLSKLILCIYGICGLVMSIEIIISLHFITLHFLLQSFMMHQDMEF